MQPIVDSGWAVIDSETREPLWTGRWVTEDGAKQMVRRMQRHLNRNGYDPFSERLETAYLEAERDSDE